MAAGKLVGRRVKCDGNRVYLTFENGHRYIVERIVINGTVRCIEAHRSDIRSTKFRKFFA